MPGHDMIIFGELLLPNRFYSASPPIPGNFIDHQAFSNATGLSTSAKSH